MNIWTWVNSHLPYTAPTTAGSAPRLAEEIADGPSAGVPPVAGAAEPVLFQAPPPVAPTPPVSAGRSQHEYEQLFAGLLRELRAEAQNLKGRIDEIRQKSALTDPPLREQELKSSLADAQHVFDRNHARIDTLFHSVREVFQFSTAIYDRSSDETTHIENCWENITAHWPREEQPADEIARRIDAVSGALGRLVYLCGKLTIPGRVNQHLATLRIGQTLDFHRNFDDELDSEEDRLRLLAYLRDHPQAVAGVVDARNGLIYRASLQAGRRWLSYLMIVGALALGVGWVYALTHLGAWMDIPTWIPDASRFRELAGAYLFLVLGAGAHLLVDALKQAREGKGSEPRVVEDWLLWFHVRESSVLTGIVYLWVGLAGVAYAFSAVDWATAFFIGYSIDSFVDLFLQRFSATAAAKVGTIGRGISG